MINSVRNTVLAIINKNNYGYISPSDYNQQINEENARLSGTGYANIKLGYEEVIDTFSVTEFLTQKTLSTSTYFLPSTTTTGSEYYLLNKVLCYSAGNLLGEAEKVTHNKITLLNSSLLTTPNTSFPAYTQEGDSITIFPTTINTAGDVQAQYIRYPKDPKWTYITLYNGEPMFDQTAADYQDFELPIDDSNDLVAKILQYAGVSIREADVVQYGLTDEQQQDQMK